MTFKEKLQLSTTVEILSRLIDSQCNSFENMDEDEIRNLARACKLYQNLTGKPDKIGIEVACEEKIDETVGLFV